MKTKTHTLIRKFAHSRLAVSTAILGGIVIGGGAALAYGPERPTFTTQSPATYVTFNSITNNASYGDERNFTRIKDASHAGVGGWSDNIAVQDGKEYYVRVLVHNNAASNLNLVARNVRVAVNVPTAPTNSASIDGFVRADNSNPGEVWDSAVMTSDKKFNIGYVTGSAVYYNNVFTNGTPLSDNIITNAGAQVGYQAMDGTVPGCYQYGGYATFKIKVSMSNPDFTVEKKVRLNGTTNWEKNITAAPGQKVDYQIGYKNTGSVAQNDVVAQDTLPAGVTYAAGSTTLKNATNPNGNGLAITSNDLTTQKGINIGDYGPTGNAFVRFTATLPQNPQLAVCGPNQLVNTATVATQNGQKSDTATVTVNKTDCTVTALPTTGPVEVIAGLVGIAAITVGIVYYIKSRKDLEDALHSAQSHPSMTKTGGKIEPPRGH